MSNRLDDDDSPLHSWVGYMVFLDGVWFDLLLHGSCLHFGTGVAFTFLSRLI